MTEPTTDPEDSALRPAGSDLHAADAADDLTANTPGADDGPEPDHPALPDDTAPLPGDTVPGDGSVAHDRPEQPDAMRTATHGRESAAARADVSDDRPTPTATPAD